MELLSKKEIEELTENYPLYSQDEKKGDTKVLYHFFIGSADWYVFEGSKEGIAPDGKDNITLFGIANIRILYRKTRKNRFSVRNTFFQVRQESAVHH